MSLLNFFRMLREYEWFNGILFILIGILALLAPHFLFKAVVYFVALYFIINGVLLLITYLRKRELYSPMPAVIQFVIAFLVFIFARPLASILPFLLGFGVLLYGIYHLKDAIMHKEYVNVSRAPRIIYSILIILASILLLFNPFRSFLVMIQFFGIILIVIGVDELILWYRTRYY